uniref:Retrovirus-related Pol polyprotein from transposon TNT 1-94 n=1 Tax=Tanacetum cinerariifolium TaxID=118510 RepID=A0A699H3C6_TANCI|nr:hypothetical protein [Tanacetum cinerariifolium]
MATPAPQDRWFRDKHIELVNIIETKRDKTGIVIKNKARLVAQGYNQREVIDYDETFVLGARYHANPKESHLIAVKRIFRKSTLSACQLLEGKLMYWSAKKQQSIAMSSFEAEYVAVAGCCANILWMKSQLSDYDIIYEKSLVLNSYKGIKGEVGTNLNVLVDKTKYAVDGLETAHAVTGTNKDTKNAKKEACLDSNEFNTSPELTSSKYAKEINLEDLSKWVKDVGIDLIDLDSPKDNQPFIVKRMKIKKFMLKRITKDATKENLNTQQIPTTSHVVPPITTTTAQFQSPLLSSPQKNSSKPEGELIKNKGKEAMSHKETKEEESKTSSEPTVRLTGSMVKSSKNKHLKKFYFVTEKGDHLHLTEEQIMEQKRIEESVKANMSKKEVEIRKEELVDLMGKIINYDVRSKGTSLITLKVYRHDGSNETIPNFKANDLHLSEQKEVMQGEIVGSVPDPFSLLVDLNIKSPKCNLAEDKFSFS